MKHQHQIQNLRQPRAPLLPRLLSGQVNLPELEQKKMASRGQTAFT
jgi:hypothetical protein